MQVINMATNHHIVWRGLTITQSILVNYYEYLVSLMVAGRMCAIASENIAVSENCGQVRTLAKTY